ncbi:MAG: hypothetical protein WCQ77_16150, partial [Planctomycetota bacterium]
MRRGSWTRPCGNVMHGTAVAARVARFDRMPVPDVADLELPDGPPPSYGEHMRLMADMLVLAFQT